MNDGRESKSGYIILYYSSLHLAMFSIVIFIHYSIIGLSLFQRSVNGISSNRASSHKRFFILIFFPEKDEEK